MPIARLGPTLVFFAHVPKTGGTSVETYLDAKGQVGFHHGPEIDWLPCSPQHMHAAMFTRLFDMALFDHAFAILRDPVDRLKSEYRHRAKRASDRGKTPSPFSEWAPRILKLSRNKPYLYDNHVRPQAEFVTPEMRLFRFDDGLAPVFDWIDTIAPDPAPASRVWKRNLSHVAVDMSDAAEAVIRDYYAADYALLATL